MHNLRYSVIVMMHVSSNKMAFILPLHNRYNIHRATAVYNCWVLYRHCASNSARGRLYIVGLIGENMFTLRCKYIQQK